MSAIRNTDEFINYRDCTAGTVPEDSEERAALVSKIAALFGTRGVMMKDDRVLVEVPFAAYLAHLTNAQLRSALSKANDAARFTITECARCGDFWIWPLASDMATASARMGFDESGKIGDQASDGPRSESADTSIKGSASPVKGGSPANLVDIQKLLSQGLESFGEGFRQLSDLVRRDALVFKHEGSPSVGDATTIERVEEGG